MSAGRVAVRSLLVILLLALLGALLPAATLAAGEGKPREYIVSLQVTGSDNVIPPGNRSARQRIRGVKGGDDDGERCGHGDEEFRKALYIGRDRAGRKP